MSRLLRLLFVLLAVAGCTASAKPTARPSHMAASPSWGDFPPELVHWTPYQHNPVFAPLGPGTWEHHLRERGWILREGDTYHLWYTGVDPSLAISHRLGYATSTDGISWRRHPDNPIYTQDWVEDMMVVKAGDTYHMFAEGFKDHAQLLTSKDRVHWSRRGELDIRLVDGRHISPGPFGTPAAWFENNTWNLFYERDDAGIFLATSPDLAIFTNVQDQPVLAAGPEPYDRYGVALNQIFKYKGRYYALYHGAHKPPMNGWSTNIAVSKDLRHWTKYAANPLLGDERSSALVVDDGQQLRLYVMQVDNKRVELYFPAVSPPR